MISTGRQALQIRHPGAAADAPDRPGHPDRPRAVTRQTQMAASWDALVMVLVMVVVLLAQVTPESARRAAGATLPVTGASPKELTATDPTTAAEDCD
jgi:hypothetical protein